MRGMTDYNFSLAEPVSLFFWTDMKALTQAGSLKTVLLFKEGVVSYEWKQFNYSGGGEKGLQ